MIHKYKDYDIVIQNNRILINSNSLVTDESDLKKFIKFNEVYKRNIHSGVPEYQWTAMSEVQLQGITFVALPRMYPHKEIIKYIDKSESEIKILKDANYYELADRKINLKCTAEPRNDLQKDILEFIHNDSNNLKNFRKSIFADTGIGKSFLSIKTICDSKYVTAIFCPDDKSIRTWIDEFKKFTDIKDEEFMIVKGAESVIKFVNQEDAFDHVYKIILISNKTIKSLIDKGEVLKVKELFNILQVGLKVFDEVHLHIQTIFHVEMNIVTKSSLYLTATDSRKDPKESKILEYILPSEKNTYRYVEEYKYNFHYVKYYSNPESKEAIKGINKPFGLDLLKYMDYVLNSKYEFFNTYKNRIIIGALKYANKLINGRDDLKISYVMRTKKDGYKVGEFLKEWDPSLELGFFNSDIEDINLRMAENDKSIIITTDKSYAGMINVEGLSVIIIPFPITSESHIRQIIGRIRTSEDKPVHVIQFVDLSFKKMHGMLSRQKSMLNKLNIINSEKEIKINEPNNTITEE